MNKEYISIFVKKEDILNNVIEIILGWSREEQIAFINKCDLRICDTSFTESLITTLLKSLASDEGYSTDEFQELLGEFTEEKHTNETITLQGGPTVFVEYTGVTDTQVSFSGADDPRRHLIEGTVYRVVSQDVHPWHTNYTLQGYDKLEFNSICFKSLPNSAYKGKVDDGEST